MKYFIDMTLAFFIDCFIAFTVVMLIIQWSILSHLRDSIGITDIWFQNSINMQLYVLTSISIPVWMYFAYFDSEKSKGTFGKRIFKLEVRDNKNQKISFGKSLLRTISKLLPWEIAHIGVIFPTPIYYENEPAVRILSYVGLLLFTIYVISIWTDSRKQTIYDKVIGTVVSKI
ncbi:MAG: RDD family protein [Vicingaceae bacterium]